MARSKTKDHAYSYTEKTVEKITKWRNSTTEAIASPTSSSATKASAKNTMLKTTHGEPTQDTQPIVQPSEPHRFTPEDDEMIAQHWIFTPGNNKADADFHLENYEQLEQRFREIGIDVGKAQKVRKRFRYICKQTLAFSEQFNAKKMTSCNSGKITPDADLVAAVKEDYYNHGGKHFAFEPAWHVLRHHPMWMNRRPQQSEGQSNTPPRTPLNAASVSTSKHQTLITKPPVQILPRRQPQTSSEQPPDTNQCSTRSTDLTPQTQRTDSKLVRRKRPEPPCERTQSEDISTFSETRDESTDIKPSRRRQAFDEIGGEVNDSDKTKLKASRSVTADRDMENRRESTVTSHTQAEEQDIARLKIEPRRSKKVKEVLDAENGRESSVTSHAQAEEQKIARLQVEARRLEAETEHERMQLDIMEKDVSTCTDEYEKEFFLFKKRKIISSLKAQEAQPYTSTSQEKQSSPNGPAPTKSLG
ncbi:hypothetical protein PTTG_00464 [Puccinia triticina 1-1 BBBD Race 1]|uniref:NAM-associated domain-containing protein n=1 Tax=Puccinia triticina (isolate 1-1 / race 1 (BBBD)) TaxID=630390 RepID=A0A180H5I0_PUCT1|nr:hypothetical protein PTTG_00464 [Puccinia triticina 1-1 BBBD Race 1]